VFSKICLGSCWASSRCSLHYKIVKCYIEMRENNAMCTITCVLIAYHYYYTTMPSWMPPCHISHKFFPICLPSPQLLKTNEVLNASFTFTHCAASAFNAREIIANGTFCSLICCSHLITECVVVPRAGRRLSLETCEFTGHCSSSLSRNWIELLIFAPRKFATRQAKWAFAIITIFVKITSKTTKFALKLAFSRHPISH